MPGVCGMFIPIHICPGLAVNLLPNDGSPRVTCSLQKLCGVLHEDCLDGGLYGLTSVCFDRGCIFPQLNDRMIFICSLIVFLGLSGHSQLFLSLEVGLPCRLPDNLCPIPSGRLFPEMSGNG